MGKKFKVSPGCQVNHPTKGLLKADTIFDAGDFDAHHLRVYQQEKFILEAQNEAEVGQKFANGGVEVPPGTDPNRPVLKLEKDHRGDLVSKPISTVIAPPAELIKQVEPPENGKTTTIKEDGEDRELVVESTETKAKGAADASPWVLDPSRLTGKSVDELNAMIFERLESNETGKPFETSEEAIAFLSADFKG